MSFANKFLGTGQEDVTNGTIPLFGSKIGAKNLRNSNEDTVKIDASGCLFGAALAIDDVSGLQTALDSKISNPLTTDLDLNNNNIINTTTIEIDNGVNSATINYNTGSSNINVDLNNLLENPLTGDLNVNNNNIINTQTIEVDNGANNVTLNYATGSTNQTLDLQEVTEIADVTQNMLLSTTAGQTDFTGDITTTGDIQAGGALLGDLNITDVTTGGTQTNNLIVTENELIEKNTAIPANAKGLVIMGQNGSGNARPLTVAGDYLNINFAGQDFDINTLIRDVTLDKKNRYQQDFLGVNAHNYEVISASNWSPFVTDRFKSFNFNTFQDADNEYFIQSKTGDYCYARTVNKFKIKPQSTTEINFSCNLLPGNVGGGNNLEMMQSLQISGDLQLGQIYQQVIF
jgi:hypothetical protein